MRKHSILLSLTFLALATFATVAGCTYVQTLRLTDGDKLFMSILPFIVGGGVAVAALMGFLTWLAFHAAHRGHDRT